MKLFEVILDGWIGTGNNDLVEACIKLVRCPNREILQRWLTSTGLDEIAVIAPDELSNEYDFEDGVDLMLPDSKTEHWNSKLRYNGSPQVWFELSRAAVDSLQPT